MTRRSDRFDMYAACHIIDHMREDDRKEIFATRPVEDGPTQLLRDVIHVAQIGHAFTFFTDDGEPAAITGFYEKWPGTAKVWAFGTDRWSEVVLSVTKHVHRVIVPALRREGFHRAECEALLEREDTKKWLPSIGLHLEAVLAGFGRQREDFGLYVWKPEHVFQCQRKRRAPPDDRRGAGGGGSAQA